MTGWQNRLTTALPFLVACAAACIGVIPFAAAASAQDSAARYALLLQPADVNGFEAATARPSRPLDSCAGLSALDVSTWLQEHVYRGRAGGFQVAAQIERCKPDEQRQKAMIADVYAKLEQPDDPTIALIHRALGGMTSEQYDGLAREHLSRLLAASGGTLTFWTAVPALQWAAGDCLNMVTSSCLQQSTKRLLPDGWRLDDAANLSLGDLFGRPVVELPTAQARSAMRALLSDGIPVRADIAERTVEPLHGRLMSMRRSVFSNLFGPAEDL